MHSSTFKDEPFSARLYVFIILSLGLPLFFYCLFHSLQRHPSRWLLLVFLTGTVSTVTSVRGYWASTEGRPKAKRIPQAFLSTPNEFFLLSGILFFSPEVGGLVGSADSLLICFLSISQPRRYRSWFNFSMLCVLAWLCGKFFYWTQGQGAPLDTNLVRDPVWLALCLYASVALHTIANACSMSLAVWLSSGTPFWDQLKTHAWFVFSGLIGATGAATAFLVLRDHSWLTWMAAVPVVLLTQRGNQAIGERVNALASSRELFQDSLNALTAAVAVLDEKGRVLAVNQTWGASSDGGRLFGDWVAEGSDYAAVCSKTESEVAAATIVSEAIGRVLRGEQAQCRLDYDCGPASSDLWFQLGVSHFQSSRGIRVIVSHQEISDLKLSERRVRESESNYRRFFEEDLTGDFVADDDGILIDCNPAFARIMGFASPEQAIGSDLAMLFPEPEQARRLLDRLRKNGKLEYVEVDLRTVAGKRVNVVANLACQAGDDGMREIRGYLFDDTRRKELEARLMQARKMDAVGQLAGGIAHEFNNILTVMMGCAEFLGRSLKEHLELAGEASLVLRAASQASRLTSRFQVFSQEGNYRTELVALDALLERMTPTLRGVLGRQVRLVVHLAAGEAALLADAAQIEQVVLNLVVNARDAMPQGGELHLRTEFVETDEYPLRLCVTDTGVGMSEEVRGRIFEPFFTTKPQGSGTGLGLATVYGIVQQCEGRIDVASTPGRGSSFTLLFPSRESIHGLERPASRTAADLRGWETILVVEDQNEIREMIGRTLRENGYGTLLAGDGLEAMGLVERHSGPIHLLVSDVVMPRINGWELADSLATRLAVGPRALFITGYSHDRLGLSEVSKWLWVGRLDKPFMPETLLRRVRAALDAEGGVGRAAGPKGGGRL